MKSCYNHQLRIVHQGTKVGGNMDHSMVIILAILTLIAIVLLLYLLPSAPSYDDKSNDKFQQGVRLDQLVRNIADRKSVV